MKYIKKVKDINNKYILYLLYGGWDSNPQLYLTFAVGSKPTDFSICLPPHIVASAWNRTMTQISTSFCLDIY